MIKDKKSNNFNVEKLKELTPEAKIFSYNTNLKGFENLYKTRQKINLITFRC